MPKLDQIIQLLIHPTEFRSVVNYKIWRDAPRDITKPEEFVTSRYDQPTMRKCWDFLDQTSRSFSMVIKELEGDLARVVCLFYLVLRALDTIEDDMTLPNSTKLPLLRSLHLKLYEAGWNFDGSGPNEKDRQVLVEFEVLQAEFVQLDKGYQDVIADIARKMGEGMADFAALATPEKPVAEIDSIADYDLYCHYVAGLVGEGLSGIFSASGKERDWLAQQLTLSNSMGMLLQKTNIFRDIKEDVEEGRGFWPKAIYGKHGFATMKDLIDPAREKEALFVASEMVLDALRHAVDALDYMTLLKCQSVFNFVSIPAVMAIATLERCFMNPDIFKKNVKIRRGEAIRLINQSVNPRDVSFIFRDYAKKIHAKVARDDPNLLKLSIACAKIEQWTEHHYPGFLEISTSGDKPTTNINQYSLDARAKMFTKITAGIQSQMAAERRESFLADLRSRGIIKEQTEEEKEASRIRAEEEMNAPFPWLLILGVVGGLLSVMALMGCGIAYIIWKYAD